MCFKKKFHSRKIKHRLFVNFWHHSCGCSNSFMFNIVSLSLSLLPSLLLALTPLHWLAPRGKWHYCCSCCCRCCVQLNTKAHTILFLPENQHTNAINRVQFIKSPKIRQKFKKNSLEELHEPKQNEKTLSVLILLKAPKCIWMNFTVLGWLLNIFMSCKVQLKHWLPQLNFKFLCGKEYILKNILISLPFTNLKRFV